MATVNRAARVTAERHLSVVALQLQTLMHLTYGDHMRAGMTPRELKAFREAQELIIAQAGVLLDLSRKMRKL